MECPEVRVEMDTHSFNSILKNLSEDLLGRRNKCHQYKKESISAPLIILQLDASLRLFDRGKKLDVGRDFLQKQRHIKKIAMNLPASDMYYAQMYPLAFRCRYHLICTLANRRNYFRLYRHSDQQSHRNMPLYLLRFSSC